jgi:hypothetical protein
MGTSVVTLLTVILFIIGVALMAAPPAGRWLQRRRDAAVEAARRYPGCSLT